MPGSGIAPIWRIAAQTARMGRRRPVGAAAFEVIVPSNPRRGWLPRRNRCDDLLPRLWETIPVSIANLAALPDKRVPFERISLRRLVLIRWVAIVGQAVTLLVVHYAFDFRLPLLSCFAVVLCSVALNLFITLFRRVPTRLGEREAAFFLGYDLLQLGLLLYLPGGLHNPFAILILAPVTVAATILSRPPGIALAILAVAIIPVLAFLRVPLPWRSEPPLFPPELVLGIWTALVVATA